MNGGGIARRAAARGLAFVVLAWFAGCGGGSSGSGDGSGYTQGTDVPPSDAEAARFLTQATFGPSHEEIDFLRFVGYAQWFEDQLERPISRERPFVANLEDDGTELNQTHRMLIWWKNAIRGKDQLRQRVAWALSQIYVISDRDDSLGYDVKGMCEYYDLLARNSLGNYRQLLEEVTLSPQMGKYLSMLKNQKANPAQNIRPDENYAREVLQLFSIGLVELGIDGAPVLDAGGNAIPTYDQSVVEGFAADFTGWNYANGTSWWGAKENFLPMENWPQYHDTDPKSILGGVVLPSGQTGEMDLEQALDVIFMHPNVGPFIGKQLIQRLVTSNPSPAYVARAAAVFADDGTGERGDLFEVVKAILMDTEARTGHQTDPDRFGKIKEPILRQTALWRAFEAKSKTGKYKVFWPEYYFGQAPLRAPSVFNFYSPSYSPPGELANDGLVAPEMQIATHTLIVAGTNEFNDLVFWGYGGNPDNDDDTVEIDITQHKVLASDPVALVDDLDVLLMAGGMSSQMHQIIVDHLNATPVADGGTQRVLDAIYLIVTAPECAVQK